MSKRRTGREPNRFIENNRLGQLKFAFVYCFKKSGIGSLSRSKYAIRVKFGDIGICQIDFRRLQTKGNLCILYGFQQFSQDCKLGCSKAGKAVHPELCTLNKVCLGHRPARASQLDIRVNKPALDKFQIFLENQADIGKFQCGQIIMFIFGQIFQQLVNIIRRFRILVQFGDNISHLPAQSGPIR